MLILIGALFSSTDFGTFLEVGAEPLLMMVVLGNERLVETFSGAGTRLEDAFEV